jgi:DNA-binding HxlR family transcriptional regulator
MTQKNDLCPVMEAANLIGDEATLLIIKSLLEGDKRYKEIRQYVSVVSDVTFADRLKKLVNEGLITRTQHQQIPPKVMYSLTKKGQRLKPVIDEMKKFGSYYLKSKSD